MTLLDVFMQYFNMDTRYGTYSDKLEPCIIHIIRGREDKECCQSFRRKVEQSAPLSIGRRICQPVPHLSEAQSTVSVHSWIFAPVTAVGESPSAFQSHHRCADGISKTTCHRIQRTSHTERRKHSGRNRDIQGCDELPKLDGTAQIAEGNQTVIEYLNNVLTSENNANRLNQGHLQAIAVSGYRPLLELEGKLLLAAKLQEGLRQAIVETMDEGCPESYLHLFSVICDNVYNDLPP